MSPRRYRFLAFFFVVALVAAACGQKEGVHVAAGAAGTDGDGGTGSEFVSDGGDVSSTEETVTVIDKGGSTGGSRTSTRSGGGGTASGGGTDGDGGTAGGGGGFKVQGTDRTGVDAECITIGIHAPVTGAAPLPTTSFENFRNMYWDYVTKIKGEKILGRSCVNVQFRDDKYTPSSARQVCRELMDDSFLLIGGGGTDQVQACGDLANESEVPYMSAGVTEAGLRGLPWYFATSMSYRQQTPLLAQYVKNKLGNQKVAMIVTDTPNFDDAAEGWEAAVAKYGLDSARVRKHPKGDQSWYSTYGAQLGDEDVKIVFLLTSPLDYIRFADTNKDRGFQYVGVGITMGLNAVLPTGCPTVDKGIWFSPGAGLNTVDEMDPEFRQAAAALNLGEPDDIALLLWLVSRAQYLMFKEYEKTYGNDLTREDFRALVETMKGIKTPVGPELNYTPDDHFGASQVHVIQADCATEQHKTLETFKSGF